MKDVIVTQNLSKKVTNKDILHQINLYVPAGSLFTLLGPNGAGKTTLIKVLMNIISPSSGSAHVLDIDSRKLGAKEFQQIGYVSENQELPDWMTVNHFLEYCQSMYPNWDVGFCENLINQFKLPLNQKIKNLSRGMKMKTALISSLVYHPKLLVLDEPFTGLDPLVREEFIQAILEITENQPWAILLSSHNIDEVEKLADWIGMIDKGELKILEEIETLQKRFKRIQVFLETVPQKTFSFENDWLFPEQDKRVLSFVVQHYKKGTTEEKIKQYFPPISDIVVSVMSLREIFIILAKRYKISNLNF